MNDTSYRKEFSLPAQERLSEKKEKPEKQKSKPRGQETQEKIKDKKQEESKTENREITLPDYLSADAVAVFGVLTQEGIYPDEIQLKTNLGLSRILAAITELELNDLAVLLTGNKVAKV